MAGIGLQAIKDMPADQQQNMVKGWHQCIIKEYCDVVFEKFQEARAGRPVEDVVVLIFSHDSALAKRSGQDLGPNKFMVLGADRNGIRSTFEQLADLRECEEVLDHLKRPAPAGDFYIVMLTAGAATSITATPKS